VADRFETYTVISGKTISNRDSQYGITFYHRKGTLAATVPATTLKAGTSFSISTSTLHIASEQAAYVTSLQQGWFEVLSTEELALECHVEWLSQWQAPALRNRGVGIRSADVVLENVSRPTDTRC
jgi:hypothetical protein